MRGSVLEVVSWLGTGLVTRGYRRQRCLKILFPPQFHCQVPHSITWTMYNLSQQSRWDFQTWTLSGTTATNACEILILQTPRALFWVLKSLWTSTGQLLCKFYFMNYICGNEGSVLHLSIFRSLIYTGRHSRDLWMWHWGTWVSGHGGNGLTVGLDDLNGIFQS